LARPSGIKSRCSGQWTEAKFHSFIKSGLRQQTRKWGPIQQCQKAANIRRGIYRCNGCKEEIPKTTPHPETRKRVNNVHVDHINPVVPVTGWVSWDDCINNMFCEEDNLQVLCSKCHKEVTAEENAQRKYYRDLEKGKI
tara:strand:- start:24921 stop:25337 length:417 start_codon:yes stop_codon:yes gene_type:complete